MKKFFWAFLLVIFTGSLAFADIDLPEPIKKGGVPLFEAFEHRASSVSGSFPAMELDVKELSQLLWSATGLNRGGKGWTVPFTKGKPPYCKIYVALPGGTYLYDWKEHKLIEISQKDIRADVVVQDFAKTAPCVFLFVMDAKVLESTPPADAKFVASVATGSMSQNIYLASESLGIGVRYIMSITRENIIKELALPEGDEPLSAVVMGKYAL